MKRKFLIVSLSIISVFFLGISICLYSYVNVLLNAENRIIDVENFSILQVNEDVYYQVCDDNVMFSSEMIDRIDHFESLDNSKNIKACEISKNQNFIYKLFGVIFNGDVEILENGKKAQIYSVKETSQYFVKKDFSLPKITSDKIESIVVVDSADYSKVFESYDTQADIERILKNYNDFFENTTKKHAHSYECYIMYKDYDLVEFISSDYLNLLNSY